MVNLVSYDDKECDATAEHVEDDTQRVECLPAFAALSEHNILEVG